ncbi:MAG: hypothetical protein ACRDD1_01580, partial [Planctomycetia bacterium]
MNRGAILIRVDGAARDGMGRVARCLALANALQRRRYQMSFVSRLDSGPWAERIRRFRHNIVRTVADPGTEEDRLEMQREILRSNPAVVVTDSAAIDEEYLAYLSNRVPLVVGLDDAAAIRFPCDLVLNPSLGRTAAEYAVYPGTQIVGGHRYAMIRSEFRRARNVRATERGGPTRILISLGAG